MVEYPKKLSDQIKYLLKNRDFFLTFGEITKPYDNKIVAKIVEEYKDDIWNVWKGIRKYFKKVNVDTDYYFSVRFMEDHNVVGGCSEFAFLTAAIFRKMGYPTAIADALMVDSIFQDPTKERVLEEHSVNLVYIDGKWWLYDSSNGIITRFIFQRMFHNGMLIGAIYRDPYDIGIRNRKMKYVNLVNNLRDILLLDLHDDLINVRNYDKVKKYKI